MMAVYIYISNWNSPGNLQKPCILLSKKNSEKFVNIKIFYWYVEIIHALLHAIICEWDIASMSKSI